MRARQAVIESSSRHQRELVETLMRGVQWGRRGATIDALKGSGQDSGIVRGGRLHTQL
jgi:hypothetical protein